MEFLCLDPIVTLNKKSSFPELGNICKSLARSAGNSKSINFFILEYRNTEVNDVG